MIKQPVKGMRDILPYEKAVREYIFEKIKNVYNTFGFNLIETPHVENIENLSSNNGGENEKLIFKVLKRGEKLQEAQNNNCELCDCGLRYDLTLPLCRFYANNSENLPYPFKSLQFGDVFRADRPQKGRTREFKQCDIDIFGESSIDAEIELLTATSTFLTSLEGLHFSIKINDRRLLKVVCEKMEFPSNLYGDILIILDKLDKIGLDGVYQELIALNIDKIKCDKYIEFLSEINKNDDKLQFIENYFNDEEVTKITQNISKVINVVSNVTKMKLIFDVTIVRGMGYYTGTIYEIFCNDFSFAVGGGGRYDNMVAQFTKQPVPAVGVSIGFERLVLILMEKNFKIDSEKKKIAILYDDKLGDEVLLELYKKVMNLRKNNCVYLNRYSKNIKRQKESLASLNYDIFLDVKKVEDLQNIPN